MEIFKRVLGKVFNFKPGLPNIEKKEEVIDWLIKYDNKIKDFRNNFGKMIPKIKEEIVYELEKFNNADKLQQNLRILSSIYYNYVFPEAIKRYDNDGPLDNDNFEFYKRLLLQESWLATKMRLEGYFLKEKYKIDFQGQYDSLIDYEKRYRGRLKSFLKKQLVLSESEADKMCKDIVESAKQLSLKEGTAILPIVYGDYLLEKEDKNEEISEKLNQKRAEGVTDEDIRKWYNMVDIERKIMIIEDDVFTSATYLDLIKKGMSEDEAWKEARKIHPVYGNSKDETDLTGRDRPLPYELKIRVNEFDEKIRDNNPKEYKEKMKQFSSYNAFIRNQLGLK